ncbi:hypothetical protein MC7420_4261 [Coleofasciculus chthonoplastes PCC 7420]|uniref:Uncharacterized protein n=1 Tax=Coleofasciculus chthonoplastes PCC 7420 TaxID=118168 RepID=B4W3V7_9CYAN|nr:hypothetical protein [Coleofasciculus chthonoplastes]EDX71074.1 hypothetical protein MC7420_4261 [Coleofasciculus chthonoplastes PCC 7420]
MTSPNEFIQSGEDGCGLHGMYGANKYRAAYLARLQSQLAGVKAMPN